MGARAPLRPPPSTRTARPRSRATPSTAAPSKAERARRSDNRSDNPRVSAARAAEVAAEDGTRTVDPLEDLRGAHRGVATAAEVATAVAAPVVAAAAVTAEAVTREEAAMAARPAGTDLAAPGAGGRGAARARPAASGTYWKV